MNISGFSNFLLHNSNFVLTTAIQSCAAYFNEFTPKTSKVNIFYNRVNIRPIQKEKDFANIFSYLLLPVSGCVCA